MPPSKAKMEEELAAGGWTQVSESDWKAPNGNVYSGVAYCWQILKGEQFTKSQLVWGQKKN